MVIQRKKVHNNNNEVNDVLSKYVPLLKKRNTTNPWPNQLFLTNALKKKCNFRSGKENFKKKMNER